MVGKVSEFIKNAVHSIVAFEGGKNARKCDSHAEKTALSDLLAGVQTEADRKFIEGFMLEKGTSKAPKLDGKNPEVNIERSYEYDLKDVPVPEGFDNLNAKGKQKVFFDENGKIKQLVQRDENGNMISITDYEHQGETVKLTTKFLDGSGKSEAMYDNKTRKLLEQKVYNSKDELAIKVVHAPNEDIHTTHYDKETVQYTYQTKGEVRSHVTAKDNEQLVYNSTVTKIDENGKPIESETTILFEAGKPVMRIISEKYNDGEVVESVERDNQKNIVGKSVKDSSGQMTSVIWKESSDLILLPGNPQDPATYEERITYYNKEENTVIEETRHYDENKQLYSIQQNKDVNAFEEYEK